MANIIKIKRSATTATPASLQEGELAYSENSDNLFIGTNGGVDVTKIGGNADVLKLNGIEAGAEVNLVDSVNTQTGAVVLTAGDVGAEPADGTILKDADIGVNVQAFDATILVDADIGVNVASEAHVHEGTEIDATAITDGYVLTADGAGNSAWEAPALGSEVNDLTSAVTWANVPIANVPTGTTGTTVSLGNHLHTGVYEPADATIVKDADIGVSVMGYDATMLVDADIGVNVEAYDATILRDADKGAANGVASLGADSKIPTSQIPAIALTTTQVVASEVAQLALTVQEGDVAVRTDESKSYIALNATNATMGDWQVLSSPTDAVTSVNSQTGVVVLGFADVGAEQADATIVKDADIGVNVMAYDATMLVDADIGVNVQAYSASNALTSDITYGTLDTNGDVGTGAGQLAIGNHNHDAAYMAVGVIIDGGTF